METDSETHSQTLGVLVESYGRREGRNIGANGDKDTTENPTESNNVGS